MVHQSETDRLREISAYNIDFQREDLYFNDFVEIALSLAGVPSAVIAFFGRNAQWVKAAAGCSFYPYSPSHFICGMLIEKGHYMEVEDTLKHDSFKFNVILEKPPVIRFIGRMPIASKNGFVIGAICLMDRQPRKLKADQIASLGILSRIITNHLELFRT